MSATACRLCGEGYPTGDHTCMVKPQKNGYLVLNLPVGEEFYLGPDIRIRVMTAAGGWCRLSFHAPKEIKISTSRLPKVIVPKPGGSS